MSVGVPPDEALRPEVSVLDGTEGVRRFGVDAVALYSGLNWWVRLGGGLAGWLVVRCLADGPSAGESLDGGQRDGAVDVADSCVH